MVNDTNKAVIWSSAWAVMTLISICIGGLFGLVIWGLCTVGFAVYGIKDEQRDSERRRTERFIADCERRAINEEGACENVLPDRR